MLRAWWLRMMAWAKDRVARWLLAREERRK